MSCFVAFQKWPAKISNYPANEAGKPEIVDLKEILANGRKKDGGYFYALLQVIY